MMTPALKKISALILLLTFPFTQTGWSADAIQMIDGQPQAVADPFTAAPLSESEESVDFFEDASPLSPPAPPALDGARISLLPTAGLTTASVTTLGGSPRPYIVDGSTSETSLRVSASNVVAMNYQAPTGADISGVSISFDNASTTAVETRSISTLSQLTLGLKGGSAVVRLQVEDVSGKKDEIDLIGVSSTTEKFWRIPVASISSALDKTKIKSIRFLVSPSNGGSGESGELSVRVNGINLSVPTTPVVVPAAPKFTNQSAVTLSGTKEANTAILINGVEVVARNGETTWTAQVALPLAGANAIKITAKNSIGKISAIRSVTITKDIVGPAGTININSGAAYAVSRTVTLNLSAVDTKGSGVGTMSFSTDGRNWSAPEAYKTSKSILLPEGDGSKTVYVKYFDKAGNQSMSYFKSIILDLLPPSGNATVGNGSGFINSRTATLYLNALDAGSGLSKMSFSSNGTTWTTAENYASQRSWAFPAGDGAKKVYVKFQDKTGKWSAPILVNAVLDSVKPTGNFDINNGTAYTNSNTVQLSLSASDVGGGVGSMSFSTDNVNWTSPEAFAVSKTFELLSGDGSKTVFVKYFDKAGNASAVYSKSIAVDATAPEVGVVLFDGKSMTRELSGNAAFTASDSGSGLEAVRYSLDQGGAWTEWGAFTTQSSVSLPAGDGRKEIIYEARDAAGNISSAVGSITVDQTAPILELLTLASVVRVGTWLVEYLSDGILKTKSYQLSSGINALTLSETDEAGNTSSLNFNVEYEREWDVVLDNGILQHYEAGVLKYEILLGTLSAEQSESNESEAENLSAYLSAPPEYEVQSSLDLPQIQVYEGENLQAAIDSAQAGQTVYLHPGTYNGHFILKSGVNLIGADQGSVVLHGNFESKKDVLQAMGDNRIENLTITGGGPYNWEPSSALNILGDHVLIRGNKISGNKDYGIYVSAQVSDVVIEKNLIQGNNVGVQLPKSGNQIRSNTFVGNNFAVNILNGTAPVVENNIIAGSTYQSIYEFGYGLVPTNGRAIVRNNTLFNNPEKGGYSSINLPPAMGTRDGSGWTDGNKLEDPQFNDPSAGDYSIKAGSPSFQRGAFVPDMQLRAVQRAAQFDLESVIEEIEEIEESGVIVGYKIIYPAGTVEIFMNDGTEILDATGPDIVISEQNPVLVNQSEYQLTFSVDGDEETKTFTLTEGSNLFTIEASDELGNRTTREFRVTLDTVPPQATLALSGYVSNDYFYDFPLTLNLNAVDQNSAVQSMRLSLDGGLNWTAWAGFQTVRSISWQEALSLYDYFGTNGVDFVAEFKDMAGNVGRATLTSTRDAEFPQGTISINNGAAFTQSREVTLSLTATDSISGVRGIHLIQYANDGSTFYDSGLIDFVTSKTIQLPPGDGLKTIQYGICDWASCIYKTAQINLDTTSPLIVSNTQIPTSTNNPNFVVDYTVDGVAKQKSFILVEGENNLSISETDSAGNTAIKEIKINYLLTGDRQIAGGGLQHFEVGELQYQINADGSRVDFAPGESIESYSFGLAQNNTKVLLGDHPQNELQILNSSNQLLKTISGFKSSAPNLSNALKVNLQDGVEAYYVNGVLKEVRTSTGIRMFDLVLSTPADTNQVPEILDASIAYPDGSVDIIWNKNLARKFAPDGSIVDVLPNGKVGREIKGAVEQTYIDVYNSNGTFAGSKIVSNEGDEIVYDEKGILKSAISADGKRFIYDRVQTANGYLLTLNSTLSSVPSAQSLIEGQYSLTGEVARLEFHNGSQISFENGKVKSALNSEGDIIDYVPLLTNGLQQGLSVVRDEATFQYDQNGFLRQIQTQNGTISREKQDTNNDGILNDEDTVKLLLEWAGAYKLTDFELDAEGKILNGVIETREGIKQKIENGILKEFETADGRRYIVENQEARLEEWKFKDGLVVKYGGVGISEILFPDGKKLTQIGLTPAREIEKYTEIAADGSRKFYENGWLVRSINVEGVQILYGADHRANKVILADGVEKLIEHQFDAVGNWIGLKIREGNSVFSYDADAELTNILVSGLYADIQDGEIQKVFTRFGEVSSPSWNEQNQLEGEIALTDGRKLTLSNGVLSRVVMPNGSVIDYQNGRISCVENEEGIYNLIYEMNGQELRDVKVNWTLKSTEPVTELITETIPIISQGNARLASEEMQRGGYLSLDGSGDYVTVGDSPEWNIGSQDFTVDFWMNPERSTGDMPLVSLGGTNNFEIMLYGELSVYLGGGTYMNTGARVPFGEWHHVAVVRSGNILKVYLDGKQVGQNYDVSGRSISNVADGFYLGYRKNHNVYFAGKLDEVRLSQGARWLSEFTPPSGQQSSDPSTLFLHDFETLQSFYEKNKGQSVNVENLSVGALGQSQVQSFSGGSAVYFDGADDSIKISGLSGASFSNQDFTIEARVKPEVLLFGNTNEKTIAAEYRDGGTGWIFTIDTYNHRMMMYRNGWNPATVNLNSGTQFKANEWVDVAVVRAGSKLKFFLNGIQQGADYDVANWIFDGAGDPLQIGQYGSTSGDFKGWMDSIRISKGVARYSSNYAPALADVTPDSHTLLLHHFDSLSPAQSVSPPVIVSSAGDAKIYTPQALFGDSAYFDGNGDAVKSYESDLLNFGMGDFTIDFRANFESIRDGQFQTLLSRDNASDIRIARDHDNNLQVYIEGQYFNFGQFKPETNRWYHLALVRKNGILKLYVDGTASNAGIASNQNMQGTAPLHLGVIYNSDFFHGMMDEFRISDAARWAANFAPPAEAYQVDKNTKFLHHFDDLGRAESGYEIKKYGIVSAEEKGVGYISQDQIERATGSQSLRLSASGSDSLMVSDIDLNNGDYTVEGWFKSESISPTAGVWSQVKDSQNFIALQASGGKLMYQVIKNGVAVSYLEANQTIPLNQWNHFAVTKQGSRIMVYLNGQQVANGLVSDAVHPDLNSAYFNFGWYQNWPSSGWVGRMDELRVSNSARYLSNFSPNKEVLQVDRDTVYLHHGEGSGVKAGVDFKQPSGEMNLSRYLLENRDSEFAQIIAPRSVENVFANGVSYAFEQASLRQMTIKGDVKVSTDGEKFKFDGSGDGLTLGGANLDFGSGDFTLEAKVRFDSLGTTQTIVADYAEGGVGWIWTVDTANNQVLLYDSGWNPLYFSMPPLQVGVFYEMSIVRKGNQVMFFRDGVMYGGVQTPRTSYVGSVNKPLQVGYYDSASSYLNGWMDRLLITKGVGRYTANYTVSESYVRDSNTEILLNFTSSEFNQKHETALSSAMPGNILGDIDLFNLTKDLDRGNVTIMSGVYDPNEKDIATEYWNLRNIERNNQQTASDHIPGLQNQLVDMDGDGDLDRIYALTDTSEYWMIQRFENGQFLAPEKWAGTNLLPAGLHYNQSVLRFYEGRHPVVIGDLVDINGDNRPDRLMVSIYGEPGWYVQINNGQGFDAAEMWTDTHQPISQWNYQATYALRVRDDAGHPAVQPLIADLIDLDGDGLLDRVVRPLASPTPGANPYDHWFFQKNNGHGFDDALIWEGVDFSFDADPKIGSSLSWSTFDGNIMADTADVIDMNGDNLPDRILMKPKTAGRPDLGYAWYIQFNNGHGFDASVLWDDSVRSLPGLPNAGMSTAIRAFAYGNHDRSYGSFLADVTGDGLPDRITLDSFGASPAPRWWVEENTGVTLKPAVAWEGIEGTTIQEISPTQDNENFVSYTRPGHIAKTSSLVDMNNDGKLDRVILKQGSDQWSVQYGTGSGFLPSKPMVIQSVQSEAITDHYDYVHISLRSDDAVLSQQGKVVVKLLDENDTVVQFWEIEKPSSDWNDHYLKLDASKANGRYLSMEWQFDAGVSPSVAPQILVEDVGLTAFRPDASLEWLDYLLTDAALVDQVHAAANDSLISQLGGLAGTAGSFDWKTLLSADKLITFNAEGAIAGTEKLNGETTTVTESEAGSVITTTGLNGTVTQTVIPVGEASSSPTQTIVNDNGTPNDITDDYTETATIAYDRIRSVTRENENKQPLQYSYEFDSLGREITEIYDPDSKTTEKYRVFETPNGKESKLIVRIDANGVETRFEYDERARLTASVIYYKGRERERFTHLEASNNQSSVRLDNGTVETYDSQGRILSHTTIEGYTYTHEFAPQRDAVTTTQTETFVICDPAQDDCSAIPVNERTLTFDIPYIELVPCTVNCEEIHRVSLDSFTDLNGNRATYDGSQVATVSLKDGTVVLVHSWTESVHSETSERSYLPKEVTVIHADGSVTEFKNGKPFSVATSSGREISIAPDIEASTPERTVLINPSSAAEFHYAEAIKLWNNLVLVQVEKFTPPTDLPVETEYTKQGVVLNRLFVEGSRQIFDVDGKLTDIYAESGAAWVHYDYDQDGKLIDIDLDGSRRDLDLRASELRAQMAVEKQKALSLAAEREQVLNETIEGEYLVQRDRLLKLKNEVESQKSKLISIPARGSARGMIAGAMNQIQAGLAQINRALTQLAEQRAQSLADVSVAARDLKAQIETESTEGMADIAAKEAEIQRNILKQEISPVVFEWYRSILGRHPSDVEYDAEVARASYETGSFDVAALKARLEASSEKAIRLVEVNAIKTAVRNQLQSYLAMTAEQKMAYQGSLGLGDYSSFIVSLSDDEAQKILTWLDGGSLHFGQSAFIALEAMLDDADVTHNRIDLARDLIIMDILTGTITEIETGDLVLSMFSLNLYAKRFGLNLSSLELNWDSLKSYFADPNVPTRLVAHIDGNHCIIITNITTRVVDGKTIEEVHYTDPGAGPENDLDQLVLSKEDFLETWTAKKIKADDNGQTILESFGYILAPRAPPASNVETSQARTLSAPEQMQIRGAFFGFIKKIFNFIIDSIVNTIKGIISFIVEIVKGVVDAIVHTIQGFGNLFAGLFTGDFKRILTGLYEIFIQPVSDILGGIFNGIAKYSESHIDTLVSLGFSERTAQKIVGTQIAMVKVVGGVALTAIGFATANPAAIGFGTSLIGMGAGDMLRLHTNLNPQTIQMIEIGAQVVGAVVGAGFGAPGVDFNFGAALSVLKSELPSLAADFASAGFVALGNHWGWDPQLTGLLSVPVGAVAGGLTGGIFKDNFVVGINSETGAKIVVPNTKGLLDYVQNSVLSQNVITQSISMGAGLIGLGNGFTAGAITGAVSQLLGNPDLLKNTANLVGNLLLHPRAVIGATAESISNLFTKMNDKITEKGFVGAVSSWIGQMFEQRTQEEIYKSGGIGNVLSGGGIDTLFNGQSAKEFKLGGSSSIFTDLLGNMIGKIENGVTQSGEFGLNSAGKFGLISGNIFANMLGGYAFAGTVSGGALVSGEIAHGNEKIIVLEGQGPEGQKWIDFEMPQQNPQNPQAQSGFSWSNLALNLVQLGMSFTFNSNGQLSQVGQQVNQGQTQGSTTPTDPLYVLANGIGNDNYFTSPEYIYNLEYDLDEESHQNQGTIDAVFDVLKVPLYFPTTGLDNVDKAIDAIKVGLEGTDWLIHWMHAARAITLLKLRQIDEGGLRNVVAVGYSGGFFPLIEGIMNTAYKTAAAGFVGLGAATMSLGRDIPLILTRIAQYMNGVMVDGITGLLQKIGFSEYDAEAWAQIATANREEALNLVENALRRSELIVPSTVAPIADTPADYFLNIFGSKDILYELGIGGSRTEFGGFVTGDDEKPIFNVEIVGADHFDYMRRGIADPDQADDWNKKVAKFVARFLALAQDQNAVLDFLLTPPNDLQANIQQVGDKWVVKIAGWQVEDPDYV